MGTRFLMKFEKFFRIVSYAAVFCGFFSLWISNTFGPLVTLCFAGVFAGAWLLEDSRWQIGEKVGTALIVVALPVFYGLWSWNVITPSGGETWIAGLLARMILCLTAIKLLQKKSDRDWIFLYLMAFFEVLLAAGLSISGLYFISFLLYLLVMTCAIIAFEIRKTSRAVERKIAGSVADKKNEISESSMTMRIRRVPSMSIALIIFIIALAMPLFFLLPRVGGAGFGGDQRGTAVSGFSDRVELGSFGRIVENDSVVMRVKFDEGPAITNDLYFRGVALDTFDNKAWSRSKGFSGPPITQQGGETIPLNKSSGRGALFDQTIYLEPLNTPVLFGLPKVVGIQGNFDMLNLDSYGSISHMRRPERISYKVLSDRSVPTSDKLRADETPYSADLQNYRSLPRAVDERIAELASQITVQDKNRYDKAKQIETYLQSNFGYTLDQKASGPQPLSDFLFNVREGHCEYFASAMAIMLRTQGIATRIVNGFHGGEYNETAGMTIVRQRHAHAWVEVYFPGEDAWVTFDPTPFAGQPGGGGAAQGIAGTFGRYVEALEAIWIQYFVAFDDQEQRSLGHAVKSGFLDYQSRISTYLGVTRDLASEWLARVRGDKGLQASLTAIVYAAAILIGSVLGITVIFWLFKKIIRLGIWRRLATRLFSKGEASLVVFYEQMVDILRTRGFSRESFQTPLEFAYAVNMPEAITITEKYQRVRFGGQDLTREEAAQVENMLERLKKGDKENKSGG